MQSDLFEKKFKSLFYKRLIHTLPFLKSKRERNNNNLIGKN